MELFVAVLSTINSFLKSPSVAKCHLAPGWTGGYYACHRTSAEDLLMFLAGGKCFSQADKSF